MAPPPAISTKPVSVTRFAPPCTVKAGIGPAGMCGDGNALFIVGVGNLFRSLDGKQPRPVGNPGAFRMFQEDVLVRGDEVWLCGYRGVTYSKNGGKSFQPMNTVKQILNAIGSGPDGSVWTGGYDGTLMVSHDRGDFDLVRIPEKKTVVSIVETPWGALVVTMGGRAYLGNKHKAKRTGLKGASTLYDACVTPRQTLLVAGEVKWVGHVFRSTDGGKTFTLAKLPTKHIVYSIAALPDGRVVAGCDEDTLIASYDDGLTFKKVAHKLVSDRRGGKLRAYGVACTHRDAVYVGGLFQHLVHIA